MMITSLPKKLIDFIRGAFSELKFVNFPQRKDTWRLGNIVILMSFILGLGLYLTDWLFLVIRNLITNVKF